MTERVKRTKKEANREIKRGRSLFHKFAFVIICLGLLPMLILSTFIFNRMIRGYGESLQANYDQAAGYAASGIANLLDTYNGISKMVYQYGSNMDGSVRNNYNGADNLRGVLNGEGYSPESMETEREADMNAFLNNLLWIDSYLYAAHFIGETETGEKLAFHYSLRNTYFRDEEEFRNAAGYENWDRTTNQLILIPAHGTEYFNKGRETVFTVARNYFDVRGAVGERRYVGTVFLDVGVECLEELFASLDLKSREQLSVLDGSGACFYRFGETRDNPEGLSGEGEDGGGTSGPAGGKQMVIETGYNEFGLKVKVVLDEKLAFSQIRAMQKTMYIFIGLTGAVLVAGSLLFSRRLTRPIRDMMEQMSEIESGNFNIELPVRSSDEIGVLSRRFNQMSAELKSYINKSYVAQIKQNEAELAALKSQIYPHFLYNTLEIIRMTALENDDEVASDMIEALSEQIHYLIGPVQDMVPLDKEISIVRKYIYLLNCRIRGKVQFQAQSHGADGIPVPKLILQPIVENAYVHGIKPKNGSGSISVELNRKRDSLEITVMDNGVGMSRDELDKLKALLAGSEPGVKNEYNWQSIGLKNVNDRIRYLYGEEYGIRITSTKAVGTMVRLLLPYREKEGAADDTDGNCG